MYHRLTNLFIDLLPIILRTFFSGTQLHPYMSNMYPFGFVGPQHPSFSIPVSIIFSLVLSQILVEATVLLSLCLPVHLSFLDSHMLYRLWCTRKFFIVREGRLVYTSKLS